MHRFVALDLWLSGWATAGYGGWGLAGGRPGGRIRSVYVDGALHLPEFAVFLALGGLLQLFDLLGIGSYQAGLGRAGHYLDVDVVLPGKEQTLADRELAEAFMLLAGEFEDVGQHVDGRWRLLE